MRQSVPVRPALLSLATGAAFVLATPAVASQGQQTQIPPASAQRQPAPDLLAIQINPRTANRDNVKQLRHGFHLATGPDDRPRRPWHG